MAPAPKRFFRAVYKNFVSGQNDWIIRKLCEPFIKYNWHQQIPRTTEKDKKVKVCQRRPPESKTKLVIRTQVRTNWANKHDLQAGWDKFRVENNGWDLT